MVGKLFAAFACLWSIGADDLSRVVRDLVVPRRLWIGSRIEMKGNGQHMRLDTKTSGTFWRPESRVTTSLLYEPAGILAALEVWVAFDRDGDGHIDSSEWVLAGRDVAHDADGASTAVVQDAPLEWGNVGWRIVQRYRDEKPFYDQWMDGDVTTDDP